MLQLLDEYLNSPGFCRLCSSSETPVIDTGREFDSDGYGGTLYLCINCCTDIGGTIGWRPPEALAMLEASMQATLRQLNEAELQNEKLQLIIDSLEAIKETPVTVREHRPRKAKAKRQVSATAQRGHDAMAAG